jgi:hypothetical protein
MRKTPFVAFELSSVFCACNRAFLLYDLRMQEDAVHKFNEGAPEIAEHELEYDVNDKKSLLGEGSFGSVWKV